MHELAFQLIHKYTDQEGYSIAIDANCADPKILNRISSLAHKLRAKIIWIHINPPENFILNKLRTHKHSWLFKDENQAVENFFARKALHKIPKVNFAYTFDTSRADLDTQISEAAKVINGMI